MCLNTCTGECALRCTIFFFLTVYRAHYVTSFETFFVLQYYYYYYYYTWKVTTFFPATRPRHYNVGNNIMYLRHNINNIIILLYGSSVPVKL